MHEADPTAFETELVWGVLGFLHYVGPDLHLPEDEGAHGWFDLGFGSPPAAQSNIVNSRTTRSCSYHFRLSCLKACWHIGALSDSVSIGARIRVRQVRDMNGASISTLLTEGATQLSKIKFFSSKWWAFCGGF